MMINKGAVAATAVAVVVGMTVIRDKVIVSVGLDFFLNDVYNDDDDNTATEIQVSVWEKLMGDI